jgi:predicted TIM-barrel fold metal-dependent hydrolase
MVLGSDTRDVLETQGITTGGLGSFKNPPKGFQQMHPAAYDPKARLKYMDEMGIWAMVMYPNVGGFGAQDFLKLYDPELMLTCVQIYNDWQTEWASTDSRRLLPITSIPFWDVTAAAEEVRRCAAAGHRGILFTGEPQSFGQPLLGDSHWNPLWEVAVELDLPISFHIGSGALPGNAIINRIAAYGRAATYTMGAVTLLLQNSCQLSDLIMSGVLARYPTIKFVSVESGIGWIPFVLETMDYQFHGNNVREERPEFDLLPSEYFARNVYACCSFEQTALRRLIEQTALRRLIDRSAPTMCCSRPTSPIQRRYTVKRCTPESRMVSHIATKQYGAKSYGRMHRSSTRSPILQRKTRRSDRQASRARRQA